MRTVMQPGPEQHPRIVTALGRPAGDVRLHLGQGACLLDGFRDAMLRQGVRSAGAMLLAGTFDRVQYLTGMPDSSGQRVATYGPPTNLDGPVTLVSGNAILGTAADGSAFVHCHAVFVDGAGKLHGGHLPPGTSVLGREGAVLLVACLDGAGFHVGYDAETNYSIFGPETAGFGAVA